MDWELASSEGAAAGGGGSSLIQVLNLESSWRCSFQKRWARIGRKTPGCHVRWMQAHSLDVTPKRNPPSAAAFRSRLCVGGGGGSCLGLR